MREIKFRADAAIFVMAYFFLKMGDEAKTENNRKETH